VIEKVLFRQLVSSMQHQVLQTIKWHSAINRLMRSTCWPPRLYFSV